MHDTATIAPPANAGTIAPRSWPAPLHDKNFFILAWRDDRYWLVGPFDTESDAATWAGQDANNPTDDPRWGVVRLAGPGAPPSVRPPSAGPMEA